MRVVEVVHHMLQAEASNRKRVLIPELWDELAKFVYLPGSLMARPIFGIPTLRRNSAGAHQWVVPL